MNYPKTHVASPTHFCCPSKSLEWWKLVTPPSEKAGLLSEHATCIYGFLATPFDHEMGVKLSFETSGFPQST
jgi:hypothetical protein